VAISERTCRPLSAAFAEGRARLGFVPPVGNTTACYGEEASTQDSHCTNKDIVFKTSADGGLSWGPATPLPFAMANDTYFYSNPNGLVDPRSGIVWVLYAQCTVAAVYGHCVQVIAASKDDGATFAVMATPAHPMQIPGVSGGIITTSGRLLFPVDGTGVLYSDDGGVTWASGSPAPHQGENMIASLANGSTLVMTMRNSGFNDRLFYYSADGGLTWGGGFTSTMWDPNCQGSLIAVNTTRGGPYFLLFANPHYDGTLAPPPYNRLNVSVQASYDDGVTFTPLLQVYPGPSAYTTLLQLLPGGGPASCAILYEASTDVPVDFAAIRLTLFDCQTGA
jgi:hypothetical protein